MENRRVLDDAIAQCQGKSGGVFAKIYPFSTENINGYIDHFDLKDKSLLTVGSSGDQAISASLKGATDITLFDINPYARYYYYLKIAAITALEYDEFDDFFTPLLLTRIMRKPKLNKNLFEKIKAVLKELDLESYEFWDTLFKTYGAEIVKRQLFQFDDAPISIRPKECPYLTEEGYYEAQKRVSSIKITFINQNVVAPKIDRKFDNIWLSNIEVYLSDEDKREMFNKMSQLVNSGGELLYSYVYGPVSQESFHEKRLNRVKTLFNEVEFERVKFPGIFYLEHPNSDFFEDVALVFKKP